MTLEIRPARATDASAIRAVLVDAFGQEEEAEIVERLAARDRLDVSLVAVDADGVAGYIAFSPIDVEQNPDRRVVTGLGPVAVARAKQGAGIGSRLIWDGLEACRRRAIHAVVLVGDPAYYSRFGFRNAARCGIQCELDVPEGVFQALDLVDGALDTLGGVARYDAAFSQR